MTSANITDGPVGDERKRRASPAIANVEFLRGYAGCPVPESLQLAIGLSLGATGGPVALDTLADRVAEPTGMDKRLCSSAVLRLVWERELFVDVWDSPIGPHTLVSRAPS